MVGCGGPMTPMWAPAIWPCLSWNCELSIMSGTLNCNPRPSLLHRRRRLLSSPSSSSSCFFLCFCSALVALVPSACVRLQQHRCHLLSRIQRWRLSSGRCFSLSCCCSFLLVPSRPSTYPELLPGTSHR